MPVHDELGTRMKAFYESVPQIRLLRKVPVAIRLDGKAFGTFTRGMRRPFDQLISDALCHTMKYLCENIQGCVIGYAQSDEITLILLDYQKLDSDAWFGYEVQKLCSVSAGLASMVFNKQFTALAEAFINSGKCEDVYKGVLKRAIDRGASCDARCFNVPKEEVTNLLYWRQLDAERNSIQALGQAHFSASQLDHKTCKEIQNMLITQRGIDWNDLPTSQKRGVCCIKHHYDLDGIKRSRWVIDEDIPLFKGEGREYVEKLIYVGE